MRCDPPSRSLARRRHIIPTAVALVAAVALISATSLADAAPGAPAPDTTAAVPTATTVISVRATDLGSPPAAAPAVTAIAAAARGEGYYVLRADGRVAAYGAPFYGSVASSLGQGVTATGIAVDPATGGYWVTSSMGQVWGFHAPVLGRVNVHPGGWGQYPSVVAVAASPPNLATAKATTTRSTPTSVAPTRVTPTSATSTRGTTANIPATGAPSARTTTASGYFLLRANGRVRAFGAKWQGDIEKKLRYGKTAPIVATGIAVDGLTGGYWVLTSNGGVYSFGAPWFGSPSSYLHGWDGVGWSAITTLPQGEGYIAAAADGRVIRFTQGGIDAERVTLPEGASSVGVAPAGPGGAGMRVAIDDTPLDGYLNPLRRVAALVPQEIDQGVDYCGSGPVYAIGAGTVLNTRDAGWPSGTFISYRLSSGPAAGLDVYVAENVTPEVQVGQDVGPGTVLGVVHDSATCMETGWANAADPHEQAAAHFEYTGRNSTAYGQNFNSFLEELGVRPGLVQPGATGPLPPGWPTW